MSVHSRGGLCGVGWGGGKTGSMRQLLTELHGLDVVLSLRGDQTLFRLGRD